MPETKELRLPSSEGAEVDFDRGSILFVGTAPVVLRYAGFTILTDPNFLHAALRRYSARRPGGKRESFAAGPSG